MVLIALLALSAFVAGFLTIPMEERVRAARTCATRIGEYID